MFTETIDDILKLLAVTVFADKRVFADEIDTFINSTTSLDALDNSEIDLSPDKLLVWFEKHRDDLKTHMETNSTLETWISKILDNLSDHPDRHAILNRMIKISKADGEVHISEKALIALTARHWDIRLAA